MTDRAIRFGPQKSLVGILTEPSGTRNYEQRPALILLNSGILHRVGACRLHVNMARMIAAQGIPSLRFDFSGIGDSGSRRDALAFEESAPLEISDAMDFLEKNRGISEFILFGLCSGSDMAFDAAAQDQRVKGLMHIDAWPYRTWKYYWHRYRGRIAKPSAWTSFVARRLRSVYSMRGDGADEEIPEDLDLPTYVRELPPKKQVARTLESLISRGVQMLYIFSGGQCDYNYRNQLRDAFPRVRFGNTLTLEHVPDADHIFTGLDHQRWVLNNVSQWVGERWPLLTDEESALDGNLSQQPLQEVRR